MKHNRPIRMRSLRLYDTSESLPWDEGLQARSRFQSVDDPERSAMYFVHEGQAAEVEAIGDGGTHHTLMVVREFRRVPLEASALALAIFTARDGRAASVVATLAHFAERAVSVYQPAYLLLAHSFEAPRTVVLITGVHESAALQAMKPRAFSIDLLLPELRPLLATVPEWYAYRPLELSAACVTVAQDAV